MEPSEEERTPILSHPKGGEGDGEGGDGLDPEAGAPAGEGEGLDLDDEEFVQTLPVSLRDILIKIMKPVPITRWGVWITPKQSGWIREDVARVQEKRRGMLHTALVGTAAVQVAAMKLPGVGTVEPEGSETQISRYQVWNLTLSEWGGIGTFAGVVFGAVMAFRDSYLGFANAIKIKNDRVCRERLELTNTTKTRVERGEWELAGGPKQRVLTIIDNEKVKLSVLTNIRIDEESEIDQVEGILYRLGDDATAVETLVEDIIGGIKGDNGEKKDDSQDKDKDKA